MNEIVRRLQDERKVHGIAVFRGIAGFGEQGQVHSADIIVPAVDLPLVAEFLWPPVNGDGGSAMDLEIGPPGTHPRLGC